jgi:ABC-2 type transport system permease protein
MYRFMTILKRDTLNLIINPMWVILCIAFPFLFTAILGLLTEGLYGSTVSSYDYYGVTMLLFSSLYAGTYSANSFLEERIKQPNLRIIFSPIPSWFIPISKIIATFLFTGIFFSLSSGIAFLAFNVNFGGKMLPYVWLLILALDFLFSCIGVLMCCIFKSEGAANQVLSILTALLGFLSGLFFPIASLGKTMVPISEFSPVTKVLDAIFAFIYDQNVSQFFPLLLLLSALSFATIVLIIFLFNEGDYV